MRLSVTMKRVGLPRRLAWWRTIGCTDEILGSCRSSFWYDFLNFFVNLFIFINNLCGVQKPIIIIIHNNYQNEFDNAFFQN